MKIPHYEQASGLAECRKMKASEAERQRPVGMAARWALLGDIKAASLLQHSGPGADQLSGAGDGTFSFCHFLRK